MNSSPHQHRFAPIDATRGLLMVLMALDHTAYFIAKIGPHEVFSLPLPDYPNAATFLARYVTHLVAPGFSFFLGAGIALFVAARLRQGWARKRISQKLIIRGLILILIEQLLDNPPWIIGGLNADIPIEDYRTETLPHPESAVWLLFRRAL